MSAPDYQGLSLCKVDDPVLRAVPSRFPPVQTFDAVASPEDLAAVLELEGWTNDRLVDERLHRLPQSEWVFGRANASVIMASFLHGSPVGMRFSSHLLGAWYGAFAAMTCLVEVANGLRREIAQSGLSEKTEDYRIYHAALGGDFVDIRGQRPDLHDPDSYAAGQLFGEAVRISEPTGIVYNSVRRQGHDCIVSYRPSLVLDVTQGEHLRLIVGTVGKVVVMRMPT